jgi:hypothetical protein
MELRNSDSLPYVPTCILPKSEVLKHPIVSVIWVGHGCDCVVGGGGVCDLKTSKFFVSHMEESMAGHMGVNGIY